MLLSVELCHALTQCSLSPNLALLILYSAVSGQQAGLLLQHIHHAFIMTALSSHVLFVSLQKQPYLPYWHAQHYIIAVRTAMITAAQLQAGDMTVFTTMGHFRFIFSYLEHLLVRIRSESRYIVGR